MSYGADLRERAAVAAMLLVGAAVLPTIVSAVYGPSSLTAPVMFDILVFRVLLLVVAGLVLALDRVRTGIRRLAGERGSARFRLVILTGFLVAAFIVPEMGLRVAGAIAPPAERRTVFQELWDPVAEQGLYDQHPYLGKVPSPGFSGQGILDPTEVNEQGFRGGPLADGDEVYRIMAFGGSTTWGTQASNSSMTYPAQLERELNGRDLSVRFEVINAGVVGYNTAESVLNLMFRGLEHDPDMVILYNAYNDLKVSHVPGCESGDYTCFRQQDDTGELWRTSRLLTSLEELLGPHVSRHDNVTAASVRSYGKKVRSFVGVAEQNGAEVILSTMAHTVTEQNVRQHRDRVGYVRHLVPGLNFTGIRNGMQVYNDRMRQVAEQEEVTLVNNAAAIPPDFRHHTDHVHLTDHGAGVLAENFADAILEQVVQGR